MEILFNRMRAEALRAQGLMTGTRMGLVTSYDPNTYAAKVNIMPEAGDPDQDPGTAETGWLPISTVWSGNGWGVFCPPSPGDQVQIEHVEGDVGSGIIVNRVFDAAHLPVTGVQSGEWWLVHQSGSFIKLTNDTNVSINAKGDLDVTVGGKANVTVTGDANVSVNGKTTVTSQGDVNVSTQGNLTATTQGNVSVSAQGTATVSGQTGATVSSPASVNVNGTGGVNIQTNGNANVNIQGSVTATVSGSFSLSASSIALD